jgi:CheY-like chemotaxis protein
MRVLVIEDYTSVHQAAVQGLTETGIAVDDAADGKDGLWYARKNNYDVIVLDLMLPASTSLFSSEFSRGMDRHGSHDQYAELDVLAVDTGRAPSSPDVRIANDGKWICTPNNTAHGKSPQHLRNIITLPPPVTLPPVLLHIE